MTVVHNRYVASLADLSYEALRCHTIGHAWDPGPVGMVPWKMGQGVWLLRLHCTSCGMDRLDHLQPDTMRLEERRYIRPDGYQVVQPATRTDFRQEMVQRATRGQARSA